MIYTLTLNPAVDLELQAPSLRMNEVNRASAAQKDCGGKGLNVSRMLQHLEAHSVAMGFVGGKNGEWIAEQLAQSGVETQFCTIAGETRTNVVLMAEDHSSHIKMNDAGPAVSESEFAALLQQIQQVVQAGDWWVLAGSLPKGVPSDCYAQLIDIIHTAGGKTLLDASGEAFKAGCAAQPTLVKPNLEEAQELLGDTTLNAEQCARRIAEMGPQQVVISLGKDGVAFFDGERYGEIQSPTIIEKNPTGAGDSLVAGLVFSLNQGEPLATAVNFGAACGAATASLPGTELGSLALVRSLLS